MPRFQPGEVVPKVPEAYPDAEGTPRSIAEALRRGPLVLAIYKSSCQASKTLFPFLERLHARYAGDGLTVFGVSQDSANIARSFARRSGVSFPLLIEGPEYPISRAFGVDFTPTVYLIQPNGTVAFAFEGFLRDQIQEFGEAVAAELGLPQAPLLGADEVDVPFFVPG